LFVKNHYSTKVILARLLRNHIKPYLNQILLAVFFMIIVAICSAATVRLVKPSIDQILIARDGKMLMILPLIILLVHTIKGVAEYYQNYLIKLAGQRILTDLQTKMYEHLLSLDIKFIQSQSSGRLISRFTNDIALMRGAVSHLLVGSAKHFLSVLFLIILMFNLEPTLSSFVFIAFPLAIYPVQRLGKRMRRISDQVQDELGSYTAKLDETFQSIRVVKSFQGEKIEIIRAKYIIGNILNLYKNVAKFDALTSPIMEILSGLAIAGIIWYGGTMVIDGETTPGALFAFITAFFSAYRPFKSLVSLNVNLQEGISAANRVFQILDMKPTIVDKPDAKDIDFINSEIIFNNVGLEFEQKLALDQVNLKLEKGKITALVGRSGGGKTSIANLLVRFYNVDRGSILIDGHDINDIKISTLRRQIALITQETILFDTSIADNISYGNDHAKIDQIIEAAKLANADEFISILPQGYDAIIGNQGFTLSGGQRQRLSIARTFLKNAPILILDEATSALDQNSEQFIMNSLKKLRSGRTILIITHRLSSITFADNIVVMKAGTIVEQGTHDQLLKNKNEYYKLYHKELKDDVLQ
jgi:subfamily B ATP-binding cassette protein MsbA